MSAIAPNHAQPAFAGTRKQAPAFAGAPQPVAKFGGGLKSDKVQFGQHYEEYDEPEQPQKSSRSIFGRLGSAPLKAIKYGALTVGAGLGQLVAGIFFHPLLITGVLTLLGTLPAAGVGFLKGLFGNGK
jgi:hypothetical protein